MEKEGQGAQVNDRIPRPNQPAGDKEEVLKTDPAKRGNNAHITRDNANARTV